jgi:hypothetical protein
MGFPDAPVNFTAPCFPGTSRRPFWVITENSSLFQTQFVDFIKTWLKGASPGSSLAKLRLVTRI